MIEIWERVGFRGREAISWERSLDFGQTWERVAWGGVRLPFVRLDQNGAETVEFITVREE